MARRRDQPLITFRDVMLLVYLPAMIVLAWIVPERYWPAACRSIAALTKPRRQARWQALVKRVRRLLGTTDVEAQHVVDRLRANVHMRQLQYLRVLRPGGWRPTLHLEEAGRIDDALARGRGAILWVSSLAFADLVTKMALAGAGIRVRHLSSFEHGFSPTRFGVRFLNRLGTSGEERFLTERLVMTPDRPTVALRDLTDRVRAGGVVSISAVLGEGHRGVTAPFLHGTLTLADGAPQLARRTGAQLLPVFTIRLDDGSFATTIGEPIDMSVGSRNESVSRAVAAYARGLERIATVAPDQIPLFSRTFRGPE